MTTIDMTGASDAEFEARIAPFEADDRVELAEVLNRGQLEGALLPTVQRLIADAEKRAAAAALRDAADDMPGKPGTNPAQDWLLDRADALDPQP